MSWNGLLSLRLPLLFLFAMIKPALPLCSVHVACHQLIVESYEALFDSGLELQLKVRPPAVAPASPLEATSTLGRK